MGVLESERDPVQRSDVGAGRQQLVGSRGAFSRAFLVERDDRVELRVALGDPGQVQVEQLAGGDLTTAYRGRLVAGRRFDAELSHAPILSNLSGETGAWHGLQPLPSSGFPGRPGKPRTGRSPAPAEHRSRDDTEQDQPGAHRDPLDEVVLR